jgi:MFS family permease
MEENKESVVARKGVAVNIVEAAVALAILTLGAVVVYGSVKLGFRWQSDGPGAGYFPFYIGVILCICSFVNLYQAFRGKNRNTEIFVDSEQLKRILSVLIPAAIYVVGIQLFGVYVASAVYIAMFMVFLGKYSWVKSIIAAVAINTIFFLMFEVWFKVPLFKGTFEPLDFLGY